MARAVWVGHAATLLLLTVLYYALPEAPRFLWTAIGGSAVLALVLGVAVHRPRRRAPWMLMLGGVLALIAGDTVYDVLTGPLGISDPFPSVADVIYLVMYPLIAAGLLLVIRSRATGSDTEALLDGLIVTIALALPLWVLLIQPYMTDSSLTPVQKAFSVAYPIGDLLLLAVLARLLVSSGRRPRSLSLLAVGLVGLLSSDILYGWVLLHGHWETGGPIDLGWIVFYATWGAAALQPDMRDLAEPVVRDASVTSRSRLLLLGSVPLVAPGILLWEGLSGRTDNVFVVGLTSAALFLLVTMRIGKLVTAARDSAQRQQVLRRSGEALVAAAHHEEIYAVGAGAVAQLLGGDSPHRILIALTEDEVLHLVHDSAAPDPSARPLPLVALGPAAGHSLHERRFAMSTVGAYCPGWLPDLAPETPLLVAAMVRSGHLAGLLLVAGGDVERAEVIDAVCATASQILLAIDAATLTEELLRERNEAHFRTLIQNAADIILVVDEDLTVVYQTPSVQSALRLPSDEVLGRPILELVDQQDAARAAIALRRVVAGAGQGPRAGETVSEWRLRDAEGDVHSFEVTCSDLLHDATVRGLVLTLHEVTKQRELEGRLKFMAFHDSLTRLPNRALFLDRVEHALARRGRHRERLAVMLVDLDDFKLVNDTRGHSAGDSLLVEAGDRLRTALRPADTCARLGGDEFAILVEGLVDDAEAAQLTERVQREFGRPFLVGGEAVTVTASIGVSTSEYGTDAADLLRQADLAMYAAKEAGKSTFDFYRPSLQDLMHARASRRQELSRALDEGQFELHYQPVLDLPTHTVVGAEALLRWRHPERGLVMPGTFIDAVEESDLALPLGRWVLDTAVAQCARWQHLGPGGTPLGITVNVAPRELRHEGFVDHVAETLERHRVPPQSLGLEITERMLAAGDPRIVEAAQDLRALGVRLAVDDFGTGYSALGYLSRFPVTALKIDRSFVTGVEGSSNDRALVEAIIRLGETFELDLVAEGIETEGQRDILVSLGCPTGQGYLYSAALTPEDMTEFAAARTNVSASLGALPRLVPGEQIA